MGSDFATGLQELINCGNLELVVRTLDLVGALTRDPAYRKHLSGKETFSHIVKLLMRALNQGDRDLRLASACLRGVALFARDKPNLMILVNLHGQINLFAVLCRAFHGGGFREHLASDEEYAATRLAAGMIANNIAVGAQVDGLGGLLIKEGVIDAMAAVIRDGGAVGDASFVAHKLITQLAEYVDSAVEKYEVLVDPLVAGLSADDGERAVIALAAVQTLVANERLMHAFVRGGLVAKLALFLVGRDLAAMDSNLVLRCVMALLATFTSPEARQEVIDNQMVVPLLGLYDSSNPGLHSLWFEAMARVCEVQEFRESIEQSTAAISYIKKAIRLCELAYAEVMAITLTSLFQSPALL